MTDAKIILQAIANNQCIVVTYNRMQLKLAPHILYSRHGAPFLDAVAVEREGKELSDPRLGTFKLAGLQDVAIIERSFKFMIGFDASDPKYAEAPAD
ncbi:WYL domain-containing protein [Sphingomonas montanisoli]|uniref:WYL domain-containing protein n=1 Tax=Sphingomonas montanisoli TaxID=2606412 RepID=A0A5D9C8C7_9SPHN|nr:WYL domain-containing protein [Sphingomonas montanisoli]TZG27340.1 WYL domain-containing protein [Sphingomonas montanisoli]